MSKAYYPYKPPKLINLVGVFIFIGASWFLFDEALTNVQGLDITIRKFLPHIVLSATQANIIFACLGLLALYATAMATLNFYKSFVCTENLVLEGDEVVIPQIKLKQTPPIRIPFNSIVSVDVRSIIGNTTLVITHEGGKHEIESRLLPKKASIDEIYDHMVNYFNANEETQ